MLIYQTSRATGPTILVTVGITIRQVTRMFLTVLLKLFMLLFEFKQSFRQISHLIGFSAARLFPGLLSGVEGLSQSVLGAAILLEPTTLCSIMGHK